MNITIRPTTIEDADAVCRINRESLGYDYPADKTRANLRALLGNPFYRLLSAVDDSGAVRGYIHLADYLCCYADSLKNIMALAVDSTTQGLGVGRKLLAAAEEWAKADGAAGVRLVSGEARTGAHQFYRACGYTLRKNQLNFIKYFD